MLGLALVGTLIAKPSFAYELVWMKPVEIKAIEVSSGADSALYSLQAAGGWKPYYSYESKAADCPNPAYATIGSNQPGAEALLSLAITARTTQKPVTLVGICGYHSAYFEIKRIIY